MLIFRNTNSTIVLSDSENSKTPDVQMFPSMTSFGRNQTAGPVFAAGPSSGYPTTPFKMSSPYYQAELESQRQQLVLPDSHEFVNDLGSSDEQLRFHALSQLNSNYVPPLSSIAPQSMMKSADEFRYERSMPSLYGQKTEGFDEYFSGGVYINPNERPTMEGGVSDAMDLLDTPEAMDEDDEEEDDDDDEENMFYVEDDDEDLYNDNYYGESAAPGLDHSPYDATNLLISNPVGPSMPLAMRFQPISEPVQEQVGVLTVNPADLTKMPAQSSEGDLTNPTIDSYDEFLGSSSASSPSSLASLQSSFSSSDEDYDSIYEPRRLDKIIPEPLRVESIISHENHNHNLDHSHNHHHQDDGRSFNSHVQPVEREQPHGQPQHIMTSSVSPSELNNVSRHEMTKTRRHSAKKNNDLTPPFRCNLVSSESGKECGKVFSRSYDLIRHKDTIHASVRKTFKCDQCGEASRTFSRMDALTRHMRVKHA
ncbi:stress-regulated transcription factor RPN4 [Sugiyamaella lignohabitans]|uniref:Stress-regulated transcription factor RPN4 n=1 Tax=Sugiyamaella lignohabitans TaxID=796027 RepID=A0A167F0C3_9ASCO|nr:stress-regulated transcription factor RPN4 [Sugiyamaella lignohabitans]ANB14666.1 stress-regulated transcription factor RPN4 [Sugiyamaella lignohabitans]